MMKSFKCSLLWLLIVPVIFSTLFGTSSCFSNSATSYDQTKISSKKSELHQTVLSLHQNQKLVYLTSNLARDLHGPKDFDMMVLVTVSSDSHCAFCKVIKKTFKTLATSLQKKDDKEKDFFLGIYHLNQHRNSPKSLRFQTIPHCQMFLRDGSIESCDTLVNVNSHPAALAMKIRQLFGVDIPIKSRGTFILLCIIFSVIAVAFYVFTLVMTNQINVFDFKYPIGIALAVIGSMISSGALTAIGYVPREDDSHLMIGIRESYLFDALLLTLCPVVFMFGILGYGGYFYMKNKSHALLASIIAVFIYLKVVQIKLPGYGLGI